MQYKIDIDLCEDYSELVQTWMKSLDLQTNKNGEDLWYEFFNLQKKSVSPQKRIVHYSKEFMCKKPADHEESGIIHPAAGQGQL